MKTWKHRNTYKKPMCLCGKDITIFNQLRNKNFMFYAYIQKREDIPVKLINEKRKKALAKTPKKKVGSYSLPTTRI